MMPPEAGTGDERADAPQADAERAACRPCRGTGRVTSNLAGEPHEVVCPWCEGSGTFTPEHDAQDAPHEQAPT